MGTDATRHVEDIQAEQPGSTTVLTIQDNTLVKQKQQTEEIILSDDNNCAAGETNRDINHNLMAGGNYDFLAA